MFDVAFPSSAHSPHHISHHTTVCGLTRHATTPSAYPQLAAMVWPPAVGRRQSKIQGRTVAPFTVKCMWRCKEANFRIIVQLCRVLNHLHKSPPSLFETRSLSPLPTLLLKFVLVISYPYTSLIKYCIQPEDGHSSSGRNMYLMLICYIHLII